MTLLQRIQSCIIGVLLIIGAVVLVLLPQEAYGVIPVLIGLTLVVYGIKLLVYYITMARYMVGGKAIMYQSIIIMDVALFTSSISLMNNRLVIFAYLLAIYAFGGVVDILRSLEAKNAGSSEWKHKLAAGIGNIAILIALILIGFIVGRTDVFVYSYAFSLLYSAIMRIIGAFKKTAIIYIQQS